MVRPFQDVLLETYRPAPVALLGAVAAVVVSVLVLAAYLPARRATRVDPIVALRAE